MLGCLRMPHGFTRPPLLVVILLSTGFGLFARGCADTCPCGARIGDPIGAHDDAFDGQHELEEGCACRCGDGPLESWPYDDVGSCEHDGASCRESDGTVIPLDCGW